MMGANDEDEAPGERIVRVAALLVKMWTTEYGDAVAARLYMSAESWRVVLSRPAPATGRQQKALHGVSVVIMAGMPYGNVVMR